MSKLTDEVVLQAVRDSLAIEACHWNMWNYANGTQQIAPTEFPSGTDTLMAYVYPLVSGFSQSLIRNKIKSLAKDGHFILRQSYKGAQIRIVANKDHSEKLKKLANKWWESMGYSQGEARPIVEGHRPPNSESELLEVVGGAA